MPSASVMTGRATRFSSLQPINSRNLCRHRNNLAHRGYRVQSSPRPGLEHDPSDPHSTGNQPTKPAEPQALSGFYSESSARPANSAARPRIAQGGQTERSGVFWHKLRHAEHLPQRIAEQLRAPHTTANDLEHQQLSRTPDTHEPMTFPELIPLSAARIR